MKVHSKKLLSVLLAMMMALGLMAPALATENNTSTESKTTIQITKTLNIGRGITVPTETFNFDFAVATEAELSQLDENQKKGYITPGAGQQGNLSYPNLVGSNGASLASVTYSAAMRGDGATDTQLTYLSNEIDLSDYTWPTAGLYIYTVKERAGSNTNITYDEATYFLKVYVVNNSSNTGYEVSSVGVLGLQDGDLVKVDGAPNAWHEDEQDGCNDFKGNGFIFTNTYQQMVDKHPTNTNTTSGDTQGQDFNASAFKLTKDVVGSYASSSDAFHFTVTVELPDTYTGEAPQATVNGYAAHNIDNSINESLETVTVTLPTDRREMDIPLRHGDSFAIAALPAGTVINVEEQAFTDRPYAPSYSGKWGLDTATVRQSGDGVNKALKASSIVVGENGAYVQFTNTISDSDITPTGIVISNLPYILMVGISLAGIGFFTLSKKRRNS